MRLSQLIAAMVHIPSWVLKASTLQGKGYVGPNGSRVVAYDWKSIIVDDYSSSEGGLVARRVSDPSKAIPCTTCRRPVVHVFWVQAPGQTKILPYGSEHVHVAIGTSSVLSESQLKRLKSKITTNDVVDRQQQHEQGKKEKYEALVKLRAVPLDPGSGQGNPIARANAAYVEHHEKMLPTMGPREVIFLLNREKRLVMRGDDLDVKMFLSLMHGWEHAPPTTIRGLVP